MNIVRFQSEHLKMLALQDAQEYLKPLVERADYGPALMLSGPAFSAFEGERLLGCGGVVEFGKHRAEVWALLSTDIGPHMRQITRAVNGWLSIAPYQRVEANVATGFEAGKRWIRLLGFQAESAEKLRFFADGRSAIQYVRFKE